MSNGTSADAQDTTGADLSGVGCTGGLGAPCANWTKCQHAQCVSETWSRERWECTHCGESWTINEDDIR